MSESKDESNNKETMVNDYIMSESEEESSNEESMFDDYEFIVSESEEESSNEETMFNDHIMSESEEESSNEETTIDDYAGQASQASKELEFLLIEKNDTKTLRRWLLKRKKDPRPLSIDDRGWTAFHLAASRADCTKCVALLLKYGKNVSLDRNLKTCCGKTALYIACENNCEENAVLLLENFCDASMRCDAGNSPLDIAAVGGYYAIVSNLLLRYKANINDQNPRTRQTALHLAAVNNRVEICRLLLDYGADPEIKDHSGQLATHLACEQNNGDILRLIFDFAPNLIAAEDCHSKTVLTIASECSYSDIIKYLLIKGAKVTRDVMRSDQIPYGVFQFLLQRFDAEDYYWKRVLDHRARTHGLIQFGISPVTSVTSVTCDVIDSGSVDHLSLLLESGIPKCILQIPTLIYEYHGSGQNMLQLVSPLGHLLTHRRLPINTIDDMLDLLLEHDIVFMDEFWKMEKKGQYFRRAFTTYGYSRICMSSEVISPRFRFVKPHFEKILTDVGVTVDYSLRCHRDIGEMLFENFNWGSFYPNVDNAVSCYDIETVQFFISNSCILEPAVIFMDLIDDILNSEKERIFPIYTYLIELTPMFHRRCLLSERSYNTLESFSPLQEEFAKSTLKQFCRSSVRQTLRGKTIKDNLFNFRRRIDELPLPANLKKYLLFQDS